MALWAALRAKVFVLGQCPAAISRIGVNFVAVLALAYDNVAAWRGGTVGAIVAQVAASICIGFPVLGSVSTTGLGVALLDGSFHVIGDLEIAESCYHLGKAGKDE